MKHVIKFPHLGKLRTRETQTKHILHSIKTPGEKETRDDKIRKLRMVQPEPSQLPSVVKRQRSLPSCKFWGIRHYLRPWRQEKWRKSAVLRGVLTGKKELSFAFSSNRWFERTTRRAKCSKTQHRHLLLPPPRMASTDTKQHRLTQIDLFFTLSSGE